MSIEEDRRVVDRRIKTAEKLITAAHYLRSPIVHNSCLGDTLQPPDHDALIASKALIDCALLDLVGMTSGRIRRIRINRRVRDASKGRHYKKGEK